MSWNIGKGIANAFNGVGDAVGNILDSLPAILNTNAAQAATGALIGGATGIPPAQQPPALPPATAGGGWAGTGTVLPGQGGSANGGASGDKFLDNIEAPSQWPKVIGIGLAVLAAIGIVYALFFRKKEGGKK